MKAIGVKLVEMLPMTSNEAKEKGYIVNNSIEQDGYEIIYPDGYKSWYSKEIVDKSYFVLNENNDGSIIMKEDVNNFIAGYKSKTIGDKTTLVEAKTINGFDYIESSACVSKENYNSEIGASICMNKIIDKIWEHLGFVLSWAKNGINRDINFVPSYVERMQEELNDLKERIRKLNNFIEFNEVFGRLDDESKNVIKEQCDVMNKYKDILNERLNRELERIKSNKTI